MNAKEEKPLNVGDFLINIFFILLFFVSSWAMFYFSLESFSDSLLTSLAFFGVGMLSLIAFMEISLKFLKALTTEKKDKG